MVDLKQAARTFGSKAKRYATVAGVAGASGAGLYYGLNHTPDDLPDEDRLPRAKALAAITGVGGATLIATRPITGALVKKLAGSAASKTGSVAKDALRPSALKKFASNRTAQLVGGGAVLGAGIGAYASDDSVSGAAKGAAIGAGAGALARGALLLKNAAKYERSALNKIGGRAGIAGAATVGAIAIAVGAHGLSSNTPESSYAETGDSGETYYSDSPIRRRSQMMNASGGLVFGLHRGRRG